MNNKLIKLLDNDLNLCLQVMEHFEEFMNTMMKGYRVTTTSKRYKNKLI